ncbi:MAG TPA: cell surface protein, partial [Enterococcus sp.]|nr:cell surface protein [Enterococcus sp.]
MERKMNKLQSLFVAALSLLSIVVMPLTTYADSNESAYSVNANIPDFQKNKNVSYFDLQLDPNQKKEISIHLANSAKEKAIFNVDVNNAATNSNGVIDYGQTDLKKDSSAKYVLNQLVTPNNQEIELQAGESKDVTFQVQMPKDRFKGIILGGIHISKKDNVSEKVDGTAIRNKYAYVIGVKLQNDTDAVTPDLKLNSAKAGLQNSYTTVFANVQNPTPGI